MVPEVREPSIPYGPPPARGVDTNVLARLVLADDPAQARAAQAAIEGAAEMGQPLHLGPTVWLELEWVLRSRARLSRERIADVFDGILDTEGLAFDHWPAVEQALIWYREDGADFADALHAALYAERGAGLLTFDRDAARLPGAMRLMA